MAKVDQAALAGGISIGAFTVIFLGLVYYCIVRHHRRGRYEDVEEAVHPLVARQYPAQPPPQGHVEAPQPVYAGAGANWR